MSFSENVRTNRLAQGLTQEQLATQLGVSAQAVSKWETTDTYPDATLLPALADALHISLDALFDHNASCYANACHAMHKWLCATPHEEQFSLLHSFGWQIENAIFASRSIYHDDFVAPEAKNDSYILTNDGFTLISNGATPFFSVFPDTGYAQTVGDGESFRPFFAALSSPESMRAALFLLHQTQGYLFEDTFLLKACDLTPEQLPHVLSDLQTLRLIRDHSCIIDDRTCQLYVAYPSHQLLALFLTAQTLQYRGGYSLQIDSRNTPLLKNE